MSVDILKNSISNICIYFYNNSLLDRYYYTVLYMKSLTFIYILIYDIINLCIEICIL